MKNANEKKKTTTSHNPTVTSFATPTQEEVTLAMEVPKKGRYHGKGRSKDNGKGGQGVSQNWKAAPGSRKHCRDVDSQTGAKTANRWRHDSLPVLQHGQPPNQTLLLQESQRPMGSLHCHQEWTLHQLPQEGSYRCCLSQPAVWCRRL